LLVGRNPSRVCNHPDAQAPCSVANVSTPLVRSCLFCPLWRNAPPADALGDLVKPDPMQWAVPIKPKRVTSAKELSTIFECEHRGAYTGQTTPCPTGCKAQFKIYECSVHEKCTINGASSAELPCCGTCPDRQIPIKEKGQ
jgi:hypothetical protein